MLEFWLKVFAISILMNLGGFFIAAININEASGNEADKWRLVRNCHVAYIAAIASITTLIIGITFILSTP